MHVMLEIHKFNNDFKKITNVKIVEIADNHKFTLIVFGFVDLCLKVFTMLQSLVLFRSFKFSRKINFLLSQPKRMLVVLKRTVSMRRFFRAPKTYTIDYG